MTEHDWAEQQRRSIYVVLVKEAREDGTTKITQCDIARCSHVRLPFVSQRLRELETEGAIQRLTHVRANPAIWKVRPRPAQANAGVTAPPALHPDPYP